MTGLEEESKTSLKTLKKNPNEQIEQTTVMCSNIRPLEQITKGLKLLSKTLGFSIMQF